jgi:hypothetical protein
MVFLSVRLRISSSYLFIKLSSGILRILSMHLSGIAVGDDNLVVSGARREVDLPLSISWMRLTPSMVVISSNIYLDFRNVNKHFWRRCRGRGIANRKHTTRN